MDRVEQGETYGFTTSLSGEDTDAFTVEMYVLQYPGDTPAISRTLTDGEGTLTSAETAALAVGQWFIHLKASDTDEDARDPIKIYITKGWR